MCGKKRITNVEEYVFILLLYINDSVRTAKEKYSYTVTFTMKSRWMLYKGTYVAHCKIHTEHQITCVDSVYSLHC
jgi:hypothetical protein